MQDLQTIIAHVEASNPAPGKCLLSFSGGKDAWGCWYALQDKIEVLPFSYYLVPDLEVVEEYLDYCEGKMGGQKIARLPSPVLYRLLGEEYVFQPPERVPTLYAANLPQFGFDDVARVAEADFGLPENCWVAMGVRAADSVARSSAIKRHGAWNDVRRTFLPIWDWNKQDILDCLARNNVKLSPEYRAFGRTFDGLYMLYAWQLKQHFPRDYQKCLEYFPFMEAEVFRLERALGRYGSMAALPRDSALEALAGPAPQPPKKGGPSLNLKLNLGLTLTLKTPSLPAPATMDAAPPKKDYSKLKAEAKKMALKDKAMTDSEFWVSVFFPDNSRFQVVFECRRQKEYFLSALGILGKGDKYIDGALLAQTLNVRVPGVKYNPMGTSNVKTPPSPLDGLESTGSVEGDSLLELRTLMAALPTAPTGPHTMAAKFLALAGWGDALWVWGHDVARSLGIELPPTTCYYRPETRPDAKLLRFCD